MDILKVNNITKSFDGKEIIKDVSLTLKKGELIGLLGVSGCGKTTLFNSISGIHTPDSGTIELDGKDITGKPGYISYMLQKDLLLPYKKIIDNVSLPLLLSGMKKKDAREKAKAHFTEFGIEGTENKYPSELSGGMRQRAALLRTYLASDGVALLDEPFSALDTITKHSMHSWYLSVMEKVELSTIFITHDIDEAIILSDRVLILSGTPGKITDEIMIDVPEKRDDTFMLSNEFLQYKRKIVSSLHLT